MLVQERVRVIADPGSEAALAQGCTCPVEANRAVLGRDPAAIAGEGLATCAGVRWFRFSLECPLHGRGEWLLDMV